MCSTVKLRPAGGSIPVFHVPLTKDPAENETAGSLISDLFSEKQTSLLPSASLWDVWYYRKQHLSCDVLNLNSGKSACAFLHFKSVSQLWLKLIICVSCRLCLLGMASSFCCQQPCCSFVSSFFLPAAAPCAAFLFWAQQSDFQLTYTINFCTPPSDVRQFGSAWSGPAWAVWQVSQHTWMPKLACIKTRLPSQLHFVHCTGPIVSLTPIEIRVPTFKGILFILNLKKKKKNTKNYVVQKMSVYFYAAQLAAAKLTKRCDFSYRKKLDVHGIYINIWFFFPPWCFSLALHICAKLLAVFKNLASF